MARPRPGRGTMAGPRQASLRPPLGTGSTGRPRAGPLALRLACRLCGASESCFNARPRHHRQAPECRLVAAWLLFPSFTVAVTLTMTPRPADKRTGPKRRRCMLTSSRWDGCFSRQDQRLPLTRLPLRRVITSTPSSIIGCPPIVANAIYNRSGARAAHAITSLQLVDCVARG